MKYSKIATPASVAVEWEDEGTTFQLAAMRHTRVLLFSMKPAGRNWSPTSTVENPDRFVTEPIETMRDMVAVAERWFAAGERAKEARRDDHE